MAGAYYNRGIALGVEDDLASAIQDYDQAIQLNPKDANAYGARGAANRELGKLEEALGDFKTFLELAPTNDPMQSQIEQWIIEIEAGLAKQK